MAESGQLIGHKNSTGDAAVDGLFGGVLAGIGMAAYLVLASLMLEGGPGAMFSRFEPGQEAAPLNGLLVHLAVSGVYGVVFGIGYQAIAGRKREARTARQAIVSGAVYGLALMLLAWLVLLPGAGSALVEMPVAHFAIGHLIYGAILGVMLYRSRTNSGPSR